MLGLWLKLLLLLRCLDSKALALGDFGCFSLKTLLQAIVSPDTASFLKLFYQLQQVFTLMIDIEDLSKNM